jgi:hypothetical protein
MPSCTKSCRDVRSHTRYHLVNGTPGPVGSPVEAAGEEPMVADKGAGEGSGAPAKSAKSILYEKKGH